MNDWTTPSSRTPAAASESGTTTDSRYAPPLAEVADMPAGPGNQELAGRGHRRGAALIDVAIAIAVMFGAAAVTPWNPFQAADSLWQLTIVNAAIGYALFVLVHGYTLVKDGQTLGKNLLGIRIVRTNGEAASAQQLLVLRYGVFTLPNVVPAIGQIVGLIDALSIFRASRRCLHDQLAGTIVVKR